MFTDLIERRPHELTLGYLYRAATTRCLNRLRNHRRRRALLQQHGDPSARLRHGDLATRVSTVDLLAQLVDRLDAEHADVFVYLFVDHLTQAEAANLLGCGRAVCASPALGPGPRSSAAAEPGTRPTWGTPNSPGDPRGAPT